MHEKTLEKITEGIVLGAVLIPTVYIALPLAYSIIKDFTKLYFKREEQQNYQKSTENQKNH